MEKTLQPMSGFFMLLVALVLVALGVFLLIDDASPF